AMFAIGKTKEFAFVGWIKLIIGVGLNWVMIDIWQTHFGNGAVAVVIAYGLTEIFVVISVITMLPPGALGRATLLNFVRACVVSICTCLSLLAVEPLGLWLLAPLFVLVFAVVAMATALILPSDLQVALSFVRNGMLDLRGKNT